MGIKLEIFHKAGKCSIGCWKKNHVKSLLDMNTVSYYNKWFSKIGMLKEKTTTVWLYLKQFA